MLTVPPSRHLRTDWRLCAGWWVRTRNGTGSGELRRKAKRWRSRSVRTCKDLQAKNKSCKCDFNTKHDHEFWHIRYIRTYQSLRVGAAACCGCKAIGTRYKFQTACDGFASLVSTWSASLFRAQQVSAKCQPPFACKLIGTLIHLLWSRLQVCVWVLKHKLDVLLHHCRHLAHFTSPKCLHNLHWKSQADSLHVKSPFNPATVNGAAWFNAFAAFTGSLCRRNAEAEATACWSRRMMRILRKRIKRKNINITIIMNMSKWKWCQLHCSWWDNSDKAIKHFQIMPNNQKKPIKCPRFPWQWNTSWEVIGGTSPTGELLLEVRKARIFCTCPSCPCNKRIMPQRKRTPEFARDCNNPNNSKATSSTIQKTILNGGPAKFPTWIHSYLCFY